MGMRIPVLKQRTGETQGTLEGKKEGCFLGRLREKGRKQAPDRENSWRRMEEARVREGEVPRRGKESEEREYSEQKNVWTWKSTT